MLLPHYSGSQYTDYARYHGARVARAALMPGDLVFFVGADGTPTLPGHVGIYAGNGKAKSVVLQFARGAFRFATGDSAKSAYKIQAPQASIGVRGTKFQVDSRTPTSAITRPE